VASVVHDGLLPGQPADGAAARVRVQARWRSSCLCLSSAMAVGRGCLEGPQTATQDELGAQSRTISTFADRDRAAVPGNAPAGPGRRWVAGLRTLLAA